MVQSSGPELAYPSPSALQSSPRPPLVFLQGREELGEADVCLPIQAAGLAHIIFTQQNWGSNSHPSPCFSLCICCTIMYQHLLCNICYTSASMVPNFVPFCTKMSVLRQMNSVTIETVKGFQHHQPLPDVLRDVRTSSRPHSITDGPGRPAHIVVKFEKHQKSVFFQEKMEACKS